MEQENINRVSMINAVITFADDNPTPTATIPAWATALTGLKAKMVLINSYNQIAKGKTSGVTTDTRVLRSTLTEMALKCANGTKGYANSVNNNTLKALVDYSKSDLDAEAKEDIDDVCQGIHDATNANSASVVNYGIVAVDITDLQAAIDLYRTSSQKPRQAIVNKSQANDQSTKLVREAIDTYLIGQMDPIINTLKLTNNAHYLAYRQAREIINLGSTSAKVRGTCVAENNAFVPNVTFTIFETGTSSIVKQVVTDAQGKFSAAKLPAGNFDFKWELSGYQTVTETNVHIAAGKELQRKKVVMKKATGGGGGGGGAGTPNIVREGDLTMGSIANIPVNDINATPTSTVKIEVTGSKMKFYGSVGPNSQPTPPNLDVDDGQTVNKTVDEFAASVGWNNSNPFLNVQNEGPDDGHYKLTFENLS